MLWQVPLVVLAVLAATLNLALAEDVAHVIRPGDTPQVVAKRYHVPVDAILARNAPLDPCRLKVGDRLLIPMAAAKPDSGHPAAADAASAILPDEEIPDGCYVVEPGDCPAGIAARFGVSLEALVRANPGLDPKNLAVGRRLAIPACSAVAPPPVTVTRPGAPAQAAPLVMDFQ